MTKVKICGITSADDANAAVDAGAYALGFNFFEQSPRYIEPSAAGKIIRELPEGVVTIGVFVNESIDKIIEISSVAPLNGIQLHGEESADYARDLRNKCSLEVIKAFRVSDGFASDGASGYDVEGILLDGFSANERGGTGATFDWKVAVRVRTLVDRLWLAGGLSSKNVREAILQVRPYAVDACSSLESAPGIKDHAKLRQFIMEAKAV